VFLEVIEAFKHRLIRKTATDKIISMDDFSSKIADVAYNYREFQEPLIEFD